jgi:hypothetical protein
MERRGAVVMASTPKRELRFTLALTPTLSPGEREKQRTALATFNPHRFAGRLTAVLPFPFGRRESWGEGKS